MTSTTCTARDANLSVIDVGESLGEKIDDEAYICFAVRVGKLSTNLPAAFLSVFQPMLTPQAYNS